MITCSQRWNFIFDKPPNGIRANKAAQLLINTVTGIIRPFTVLDSSIDKDDQITYRLIPDDGYQDDPELESELMIEDINGSLTKFAIIVEEVNV